MLKTIRDQDRSTKSQVLNLSNVKMWRRDNLINETTRRKDTMLVPILSISLTRQPGEGPWEIMWEFSSINRVRTLHVLNSGHQEIHFLKITTFLLTLIPEILLLMVYPLISSSLSLLKSNAPSSANTLRWRVPLQPP